MTIQIDGLQRTRLDNGLLVLTREVHIAPVTSFWIWYRVGGRNERPGLTGLSHWVEHMLFKGTPTFPQGEYDRLVQREGGYFNGMTWLDWTTYYETLPADRIELALRIESDRMTHSLFEPEEVERERTVILSEREGNENRPTYLLFEQVQAISFMAHPYRHMVIGLKEDLHRITREDLYAHYRRYYAPNNAVAAVVGDFETKDMLDQIERYFGRIPRGPEIEERIPKEPPARAERRVRMEGAGGATYLRMAFRGPRALDEDFFPMVVLDALLSGPKGMPPFGGGGLGRSARLYRALVNEGLAISVHSSFSATIDPYLFTISVTARPGRSLSEVEERVLAELTRLQEEPAPEEELARAIKGARAQFVYGMESVTNQAMWLGFAEMVASSQWLGRFLDSLARVSAADVQRVARVYFRPRNRVVGWYVAREEG
ncbi:MAG: insulinase family protein [Chloroflexi bacterium]|nr:insulinase family protein [Chloroflexota bacterium]